MRSFLSSSAQAQNSGQTAKREVVENGGGADQQVVESSEKRPQVNTNKGLQPYNKEPADNSKIIHRSSALQAASLKQRSPTEPTATAPPKPAPEVSSDQKDSLQRQWTETSVASIKEKK